MLKDLRGKLKFDEKRNKKYTYTSKIQTELEWKKVKSLSRVWLCHPM